MRDGLFFGDMLEGGMYDLLRMPKGKEFLIETEFNLKRLQYVQFSKS